MFDWDYALRIVPQLLSGLEVTLEATLGGMALALVLGLVWAVLRRAAPAVLAKAVHWGIELVRSTPLLVQLYFLFYVLPDLGLRLSPLATGVLGLGLHYSAYTAEVYRAGIEAVPRAQWEAALALSLGRTRTWLAIILPQAIPPVIPVLGNYLIAMFKDSPMLAAITVMEMLQVAKLIGSQSFRYLEPLTLVGLLFLAVSLVSSRLISALEKHYGSV
jgi:polar amino acid transport system permease protein